MSQTYLATGASKTIKSLVLKSFIQYGRFVYYNILQYNYSVKVRKWFTQSVHTFMWVHMIVYIGVHGYTWV